MARKQPIAAPTEIQARSDQEIVKQVREYKLITPLFGGGVEPGEADPVTVVRASEIRGHLRFWWRATRGGQFGGDLAKMKLAEDILWGSASTKKGGGSSLVQVQVEILDRGFPLIPEHSDPQKAPLDHEGQIIPKEKLNDSHFARSLQGLSKYEQFNKRENRVEIRDLYAGSPESIDGYLAFPLRKEESGQRPGLLIEGVSFCLRMSYPREWSTTITTSSELQKYFADSPFLTHSPAQEVAAALWAWETFGGVGARTRRGFGSVMLDKWLQGRDGQEVFEEKPAHLREVKAWITKHLDKIVIGDVWPSNVPHVSKTLLIESDEIGKDSKWVWRRLGQKLKAFRQRRNRGYKGSSFGRSKWPEPDVVRKMTGKYFEDLHDQKHNHRTPIYNPVIESFPRAAFGLPISFAFQRDQTNPRRARAIDPPGTNTLEGDHVDHQRYSSPLLLRPIRCSDGQYVGLAIVLQGTNLPPMGLLNNKSLAAQLTADQAKKLRDNGITELPLTSGDVLPIHILEAFLKSLKGATR